MYCHSFKSVIKTDVKLGNAYKKDLVQHVNQTACKPLMIS
jgi:hypothetical protein